MTWLRSAGLRLVLAIGLGFALWVFVSYTRNPDLDTSFDSVPVNITGLSPGLVLVDKDGMPRNGLPPVNVTVQADTDTLKNVQQSSLRAYVDVSGLGPGEHQVRVEVEPTRSDLKRLTFSTEPDFLPIRLEQEITRTVPLTIEVTGNVPFSFEKGEAGATIQDQPVTMVLVRGPKSRVDLVARARATANIDRLTANYSSPRPVEPLTKDGQAVAGVMIEPQSVNVLVPIISSAGVKRVPVLPSVVGEPASGYVVTGLSVAPQFVRLAGGSGALETIQSVATEAVDIRGAAGTISRTVKLREPASTPLLAGEPLSATVTVQIAPIERPFQVTLPAPVQLADVGPDLIGSVSPTIIQVRLSGSAAQLAAFDPAALVGIISARGRDAGIYSLAPTFALPQGITLAGEPPKVTVTLRPPPSPTPEATPTTSATLQATATPAGTPTAVPTQTPTVTPES